MMNRSLYACLMAGAALALGACVGPDDSLHNAAQPLLPTTRYVLKVEEGHDRIALAVRQDSLSANQFAALASLAGRYRASGAQQMVIEVANPSDGATSRMVSLMTAALENQGVPRNQIAMASYQGPGDNAPVVAGFETLRAHVPQCGTQWGNLSRTGNNAGASNFGCAVNANIAAQIASPADIVAPRTMTPPSAQRRTVVFDAYRQGTATSSAREPLLDNAQISSVVE